MLYTLYKIYNVYCIFYKGQKHGHNLKITSPRCLPSFTLTCSVCLCNEVYISVTNIQFV